MPLLIPHHQGCKLKLSASAAVLAFLMIVHCVSAVEPETCYSRQHQKAIVNVRQALNNPGVLMDARVVRSERDCVLACCSEEVKPGTKCNMVVFNGKKQHSEDNCFLFHCPAEQDCPLMKAVEGINTYDIYKGLIHLTTEKPTATTTLLTSTSSPTPTTMSSPPTTTTTTTTTTTISTTTQTSTTVLPPTTQSPTTSPALYSEPPRLIIIITTIPAVDTSTTDVTSISLRRPNKTSKKQNKNSKKGRLHPLTAKTTPVPTSATTTLHVDQEDAYRTADEPQCQTELCTTTPTTTTTTPTKTPTTTITTTATSSTTATITTTTTTAPPPTTSTTTDPPTTSTTTEKFSLITTTPAVSLLIVPKGVVQPEQPLQDQSQAKAATMGRGAVKSGVVAFMVLGLAVLTMALAIGGRKAMESFDRRHYTRLELNDLHYEV